jgi:hypothetical protein
MVDINWDIERYLHESVAFPSSKPPGSSQSRLASMFPSPGLGRLNGPATLIGPEGQILAWHLPGVMNQVLQVSSLIRWEH